MPGRPRVAITLTQCWHRVPGGSATSILRLVGALQETGEVDLVGVGPRGDLRAPSSLRSGRLPADPWTPPVPVAQVPLPLPLLYDAWARGGRPSIEAATGPVDLVHLTVPVRIPQGRAPVVATVHDLFPLTDPGQLTARGARLTAAGLRWTLQHARALLVPSDVVAAQCAGEGVPSDRIHVVPWGAGVAVPGDDQVARTRAARGAEGPYVLFIGTVEPRKNVAGLTRAMALLGRPDVALVLVGPPGWGPSIDDELAAVPGPVVRTGFLPEAELAALARGASVCCFPSLAEGFGLPVLEALGAGAAVVTSRGTATEEVAGGAAVLADPHDPQSIAVALRSVLEDDELAADLRLRGPARAAELTWQASARRTLDAYEQVLG
jgi:glycosyltransferase involved in cell wall biosynthesis